MLFDKISRFSVKWISLRMKICFAKQGQKNANKKTLTHIVKAKEKKESFCLNSPCVYSPEETALQIGPGIDEKIDIPMEQQISSSNMRENIFCVPVWWNLRKLGNHQSILTCAQTGIFIMAQESFMDIFSELTSFSSNPSPSFKRWIKRRSVLEAWTSCTYLWWTVNETREALFSIKWGLRQNWVCDIWCQCRKSSRRNLVGDSPTEQFLRSRGLGEKQTLPHLVSQHRKTSWASLLE